MTFKSLFFSSSSQQISFFFHFLKYFTSKSPTFPSYFCSYIFCYFFGSLSKNDATRTKRFSRLYCRLANKSLKLLFLVPFFLHTEFSQPKESFFTENLLCERIYSHIDTFFSIFSSFSSRGKFFQLNFLLFSERNKFFFDIFPQATAFFFQYKMFYINFIKLCALYEIFQQIKNEREMYLYDYVI
jgi:hypothetical protein